MCTMCSRELFTKKCRQQQIFDSDLKGAWHYNHVTFTPIAKHFILYCRLIYMFYMLSILCVRLTIKVKVGIPESFKVGWYPPKKLGRVTLHFRYFNTNSKRKVHSNIKFFPERDKNGAKSQIIFFSISRNFRPFSDNSRFFRNISEDY